MSSEIHRLEKGLILNYHFKQSYNIGKLFQKNGQIRRTQINPIKQNQELNKQTNLKSQKSNSENT